MPLDIKKHLEYLRNLYKASYCEYEYNLNDIKILQQIIEKHAKILTGEEVLGLEAIIEKAQIEIELVRKLCQDIEQEIEKYTKELEKEEANTLEERKKLMN